MLVCVLSACYLADNNAVFLLESAVQVDLHIVSVYVYTYIQYKKLLCPSTGKNSLVHPLNLSRAHVNISDCNWNNNNNYVILNLSFSSSHTMTRSSMGKYVREKVYSRKENGVISLEREQFQRNATSKAMGFLPAEWFELVFAVRSQMNKILTHRASRASFFC